VLGLGEEVCRLPAVERVSFLMVSLSVKILPSSATMAPTLPVIFTYFVIFST